jgi:transposase
MSHHVPDPHEVAALREAGYSAAELAENFGVCLRTIYNWLAKAGWESEGTAPPSKRPPADILRTLYIDRRKPCTAIATLYKVDVRTVRRWLAAYNISRAAGDHNNSGPRKAKRPGSRSALARHNKENE